MLNLNKLRELFRSRYSESIEEEVARLRAENRALLNSLLGTAGFPPVDFPAPPQPRELPRLRRRSWHQIQALKESESQPASAQRNASM
jgi:hypothetical protein